ncbi:unnamed protein product, partial [marine sediment metagenome]
FPGLGGDEMNLMPSLRKVVSPILSMDAFSLGNKTYPHFLLESI